MSIKKYNDFAHYWPRLPAIFSGLTLAQALIKLNLTAQDAAQVIGVTPRTLRHYLNSNAAPWPVLVCLWDHSGYVLHEGFKNWQFHQGRLYAPDAEHGLNAAELKNVDFMKGVYLRALDENERLSINNVYLLSLVNAASHFKQHHPPFQFEQIDHQCDGAYVTACGQKIIYEGYIHTQPAIVDKE